MTRPDWLVPGAKVAVVTDGRLVATVEHTTISRVLKRDVVLANGDRFNADRRQRSSGTWGPTTYLLPPDDPRVERAQEQAIRERTSHAVENAMRSWRETGDRHFPARAKVLLMTALGETPGDDL